MDDKEFYAGKIKYVLENDPQELEIYFTDDVFDNNNKFIKVMFKNSLSHFLWKMCSV